MKRRVVDLYPLYDFIVLVFHFVMHSALCNTFEAKVSRAKRRRGCQLDPNSDDKLRPLD